MGKKEQFLKLYREYEGLLRDHGKDYKAVEEASDDMTMNRMRMNRQMRNYLSHNADPSFLEISTRQIWLLEEMIQEEKWSEDLLKDHLYTPRVSACTEDTAAAEIVKKMGKHQWEKLPILRENHLAGTVSIYKLAGLILKDPSVLVNSSTYKPYGKDILCLSPDTPMSEILEQYQETSDLVCCTSDGTWDGKFLGLLKGDE